MITITDEMRKEAEKQIVNLRKEINYDTRDYSIDFLVMQFHDGEFYIPDEYQRKFIWNETMQSQFIESVLLGLPIPFMFFSDSDDGRCEVIDGAQRTQTLVKFMDNDLFLSNLKKITLLNNFTYNELSEYYKRRFKKTTLRIIVLSDETTLDVRQEIFKRINTAGMPATPSEIRRGSYGGPFMKFLHACAENPKFIKICPISENSKKRYEDIELVLRFFAFLNKYKDFKHQVDVFLDDYVEEIGNNFNEREFTKEFESMISFVDTFFEFGFRKNKNSISTPRVRFESIAVGVGLALRINPDLVPHSVDWLQSDEFKYHTTTHASNSQKRLSARVEYVRDMLLSDEDAGSN